MNSYHAEYKKVTLKFIKPMGPSRGILYDHQVFILGLQRNESPGILGLGEASPLKGLSVDDRDNFEVKLAEVCTRINGGGLY